jgi:hypothetical protein
LITILPIAAINTSFTGITRSLFPFPNTFTVLLPYPHGSPAILPAHSAASPYNKGSPAPACPSTPPSHPENVTSSNNIAISFCSTKTGSRLLIFGEMIAPIGDNSTTPFFKHICKMTVRKKFYGSTTAN